MDDADSEKAPESAEALKPGEESGSFVSPGIWQLAFPSILGNLSYSVVAMVQTKFVGGGGWGACSVAPGSAVCLRDAGEFWMAVSAGTRTGGPGLGRRDLQGGEPRSPCFAGAGRSFPRLTVMVLACSTRAPSPACRTRPLTPGPGRGEHPHVELVQPRLRRHFILSAALRASRGRLVAALDRHRWNLVNIPRTRSCSPIRVPDLASPANRGGPGFRFRGWRAACGAVAHAEVSHSPRERRRVAAGNACSGLVHIGYPAAFERLSFMFVFSFS